MPKLWSHLTMVNIHSSIKSNESCFLEDVVFFHTRSYAALRAADLDWIHTSYLSFFLHGQSFWRIKFTLNNANFLR